MDEMRYTISDAAKMVQVESHVLRYWEDELDLNIPRNEMGHRYYTKREIDIFSQIQALKEKGFQLKAIKDILDIMYMEAESKKIIPIKEIQKNSADDVKTGTENEIKNTEEKKELAAVAPAPVLQKKNEVSATEKISHFKYMMDAIISQALQQNNMQLEENITRRVVDQMLNEMDILDQERERKEELRFRKLDEVIRGRQRGYQEAAMTKFPPYTPSKMNKRRFGLFHR